MRPFAAAMPALPRSTPFTLHPSPSDLQPLLAYRLVRTQTFGRALEHDLAVAHDVQALRDTQRDGELLLDQQNGNAALLDLLKQARHQLDDHRRQALSGLVDHDELGVA